MQLFVFVASINFVNLRQCQSEIHLDLRSRHIMAAAEDVFLSALRRKINHYASLMRSGAHAERVFDR